MEGEDGEKNGDDDNPVVDGGWWRGVTAIRRARREYVPPAPLLVALLVVLAGCGGVGIANGPGGTDDEPTSSVTPAPVPTATVDPYPLGVSPGGIDPQAIGMAMRTTLRGTPYEWTLETRGAFETTPSTPDYVGSRIHAEVSGPTRFVVDNVLLIADSNDTTRLSTSYVNGSRVLSYGGENVTARPVSTAQFGYPSRVAANVVGYLRVSRVETTLLENGSVHIRGNGSTRRGFSNYSVDALVGPDGVVHSLDAEFTRDDRTQSVRFRLDRRHDFEPPVWADDDVTVAR
jgi:hypothetical protein